jgi:hypothetical protein
MPKFNKQKPALVTNSSPVKKDILDIKKKGTSSTHLKVGKSGPHSRNITSDVFTYKGKTTNAGERITATSRNTEPGAPKPQLNTLTDALSDRTSMKERN